MRLILCYLIVKDLLMMRLTILGLLCYVNYLAYVFIIIITFDKLKARADDLFVTAQCEAKVPEFEGQFQLFI
jgi:hypothetical protein